MTKEKIKQIIDAANLAPSGGNSQPWKFIVEGDAIEVVALPEKDHKVLNFRNRGTYLAHGALIENVYIMSMSLGYKPNFEFFPRERVTVRITFKQSEVGQIELSEVISHRHSNRKKFEKSKLPDIKRKYLFQDISRFPGCKVLIGEDAIIKSAAPSLAVDTSINLKNELLHSLLFHEVLWKEKDQKYRPGLFMKTLEMSGPKALVFRLLSHWPIVNFFNKAGLIDKISQENVKTAESAGLVGVIEVKNDDQSFIEAGRLVENIWLRATKLGLGFHIITGLVFYWQQLNFGDKNFFSENDAQTINYAYVDLKSALGVKDGIIALAFRIGIADKPLATSYKRPPEIEWR